MQKQLSFYLSQYFDIVVLKMIKIQIIYHIKNQVIVSLLSKTRCQIFFFLGTFPIMNFLLASIIFSSDFYSISRSSMVRVRKSFTLTQKQYQI